MDDSDRAARPLGWWLKEADARIDNAFERALGGLGLDRRRWQILATLAAGPAQQGDIAAALSRFDDDAEIAAVVADLLDREMVRRDVDGALEITDQGAQAKLQAAEQIDRVRTRVSEALGDEGYGQLVGLLMQLVDGLSADPWRNGA